MKADPALKSGSFLWQVAKDEDYTCFPLPEITEWQGREGKQLPNYEAVTGTVRQEELLGRLSDDERAALGRILPSLACGEESAVHAFYREGNRTSQEGMAASRSLLYQIAREEEQHELLLRRLRSQCPVPNDLEAIRRRAQWFFLQIASKDPAIHFARIAGLDSGVCILMAAAAHKTPAFDKAPAILQIFGRIRSDEARHVKFSRKHAIELGTEPAQLAEGTELARKGLVDILSPLGDAFEIFGVDADRLFRRILSEVIA